MITDGVNMAIIDVSEVVSIYMLFGEEGEVEGEDLQQIANESGNIAESYGKQIEDSTVTVVDFGDEKLLECQLIFSIKEIDIRILNQIMDGIKDIEWVGGMEEGIITSNINETKKKIRSRYKER